MICSAWKPWTGTDEELLQEWEQYFRRERQIRVRRTAERVSESARRAVDAQMAREAAAATPARDGGSAVLPADYVSGHVVPQNADPPIPPMLL